MREGAETDEKEGAGAGDIQPGVRCREWEGDKRARTCLAADSELEIVWATFSLDWSDGMMKREWEWKGESSGSDAPWSHGREKQWAVCLLGLTSTSDGKTIKAALFARSDHTPFGSGGAV
jgi:hypothetical protein